MPGPRALLTGLAFGESPRWHDGRLWFSDFGSREVVAVDLEGNSEVIADVPGKRCVRVREGGQILETIDLDRGCFACALGGPDRQALFLMAAEYPGAAGAADGQRTGQVLTVRVSVPGAGWP